MTAGLCCEGGALVHPSLLPSAALLRAPPTPYLSVQFKIPISPDTTKFTNG